MAYSSKTAYKAYSCAVKGGLSGLVTSITGLCNVRGQPLPFKDAPLGMLEHALMPGTRPGEAFCKLVVTLHHDPGNPLHCAAHSCTFEEGKSSFTCKQAACGCPVKGLCMPLIQGIVNNIGNSSIGIECKTGGDCILNGLQPRLELACGAGECTQPRLAARALPSTQQGPMAKPFPIVAVLACSVPALLAAMGAVGLAYVAVSGRLFCSGARRDRSHRGDGGSDAAGGDPVERLALKAGSGQQQQLRDAPPRGSPSPMTASITRHRPLPAESMGDSVRFEFESIYCTVPDRASKGNGGGVGTGDDVAPSNGAEPGTVEDGVDRNAGAWFEFEGRGQKVLLHGVSGSIAQGEVVGVMGPSGAGKSTLLSILSGATESVGAGARIEGTVSLGGESRRGVLRRITAFVPQKDVLLPALTVEECVRYSALLRLPRSLGADEIQERIDGVLSELGLSHVATSLVGGSPSIRGVSGGERRRVTIAMALVTRPRLVIMDEPTSGLDSYTAYNLMRTAQDIASHGRVVIMSLHQPSPDMFESLSQVLLLAKGRLAYLGAPSNVGLYFAAAGYPLPAGRQPAEHMLHVASQPAGLAALLRKGATAAATVAAAVAARGRKTPEFGGGKMGLGILGSPTQVPRIKGVQTLKMDFLGTGTSLGSDDEWQISTSLGDASPRPISAAALAAAEAQRSSRTALLGTHTPPLSLPSTVCVGASTAVSAAVPTATSRRSRLCKAPARWAGAVARECAVLYWRAFTNMRREPRLLLLHMLVALVLGLVVGAVFFKLDASNVGLQNRLGAMFFALALFGWTSVSVVDGLVLERELVEREVAGHYYGGGTYMLSSLVLDGLLLRTLPALLFCSIMYPMVGLVLEVSRVVTFMFVLATYTCTVGALTTALTALCRTSSATTLAMNIILLMWVLVGGYLVNPNSIPVWMRWIRLLSPLSFAFEVLAANEMSDQYFSIQVDGFPEIGGIKGDVFLRTLGLDPSRKLRSAGALVAFYCGAVGLAFFATSYTLWRRSGGSWRSLIYDGRRGDGSGACTSGSSGAPSTSGCLVGPTSGGPMGGGLGAATAAAAAAAVGQAGAGGLGGAAPAPAAPPSFSSFLDRCALGSSAPATNIRPQEPLRSSPAPLALGTLASTAAGLAVSRPPADSPLISPRQRALMQLESLAAASATSPARLERPPSK